jgi:hypothetical protein
MPGAVQDAAPGPLWRRAGADAGTRPPPSSLPPAQVTGLGPLGALSQHLADPMGTTIFSKAVVIPGQAIVPPCAIPESVQFQGITINTPCFLQGLWP